MAVVNSKRFKWQFIISMREAKCAKNDCWQQATKKCTCRYVKYCSLQHAKDDWADHKPSCMRLRNLSCDGFTSMMKFNRTHMSIMSYRIFLEGVMALLEKIYMSHNLLRITNLSEEEIGNMTDLQQNNECMRANIRALERMQPDVAAFHRAQCAKEMMKTTRRTHLDWIMATYGVFANKILAFLVSR